jgi:hypothetical protein
MATGGVTPQRQNADPILDELKSLRAEVDKQTIQLEYYERYQNVLSEVQEIKHDIERKWNYVRIAGAIGSVVVAVLGAVGYRSFSDISRTVNNKVAQDVEAQRTFYGDLMAGTALTIEKNYTAAIPKLKKCFDEKHTYDKSVLIPLLESINLTDDWDDAAPILKKLRSDPMKFDQINDATVYRVIGAIEVQSGLSQRSTGIPVEGSARMDQGFSLLKHALAITAPNDVGTRMHILNNLWLYHIANGQIPEALEDVEALERLSEDAKVYGWSNIQKWRCLKDLAATNDPKAIQSLRTAAQQWKRLEKRYIKE